MPFSNGGVLFELLNQMEGLAEDEDLLFLLSTNRPVRKQRPRDGPRLDMHPLRQPHQLRRLRVIQRYIHPLHHPRTTRVATRRVEPCSPANAAASSR
ncbi:MAG: hypothetical protein QOH12_1006 [Solirubrobacteraceae bacterium]|jgi:hypothetical protein|nr:hypothetical protein [Solirubrobacteraceae bacterium]